MRPMHIGMSIRRWIIIISIAVSRIVLKNLPPPGLLDVTKFTTFYGRVAPMKGGHDDTAGIQKFRQVSQPKTHAYARNMGKKRPYPNNVIRSPKINFSQILFRVNRRCTETFRAKVHTLSIKIGRVKRGIREKFDQVAQDAAMATRQIQYVCNFAKPARYARG